MQKVQGGLHPFARPGSQPCPLCRAPCRARGAECAGTARMRCGALTAPPPSTGAATFPQGPGPGECDGWGSGVGGRPPRLRERPLHAPWPSPGSPQPVFCAQGRPALQILLGRPRPDSSSGSGSGSRGGGARPELRAPGTGTRQGQCSRGEGGPRGVGRWGSPSRGEAPAPASRVRTISPTVWSLFICSVFV